MEFIWEGAWRSIERLNYLVEYGIYSFDGYYTILCRLGGGSVIIVYINKVR